jgi:benzoyl-CoA 2,3-dioxygenase component B
MFTFFTDRDGKFQLVALSESGFDPLSRTCRFMLTEEAFHMSVGETGIGRVIQRAAELMQEGGEDVRKQGGIDLPTLQKYLNFWFSVSLDLFGGEVSTNAAQYFATGLKGRYKEPGYGDHKALESVYSMDIIKEGNLVREDVPLRNAMNEVLRDAYIEDSQKGVERWNRILEKKGMSFRFTLPHRAFNRGIGTFAGHFFAPDGKQVAEDEWNERSREWLPSGEDRAYVKSLMIPVYEPGKIASWIAPPPSGVKDKPFEFEYVHRAE